MEAINFEVLFGVVSSLIGTAIGIFTLMWKLSKDKRAEADKLNETLTGLSEKMSQNKSDLESLVRAGADKLATDLRREVDSRLDAQDQKITKIETRLESGGQQMARIEERINALPDNGDFSELKAKQAEMVATLAGQTRMLDLIHESVMTDKRGGV